MTEYQVGDRVVTRGGHEVTLVANEHQQGIDPYRPKTEYPLAFLDPDAVRVPFRSVKRDGSWDEYGKKNHWDIVGFQQGYEQDRPASWTPGNYQPGDRVVLSDGRKVTLEDNGDTSYPLIAKLPTGPLTFCRNGRYNALGIRSVQDIVCYQKGYEPKPAYQVGDRVVTREGSLVTLVANDPKELDTASSVETHPLAYRVPEHNSWRSVTREGGWVRAGKVSLYDIVRHQTPEEVKRSLAEEPTRAITPAFELNAEVRLKPGTENPFNLAARLLVLERQPQPDGFHYCVVNHKDYRLWAPERFLEPVPVYQAGDQVVTRKGELVTLVANALAPDGCSTSISRKDPLAYWSEDNQLFYSISRHGDFLRASQHLLDVVRHQTPEEKARQVPRGLQPLQPPGQAERLACWLAQGGL